MSGYCFINSQNVNPLHNHSLIKKQSICMCSYKVVGWFDNVTDASVCKLIVSKRMSQVAARDFQTAARNCDLMFLKSFLAPDTVS